MGGRKRPSPRVRRSVNEVNNRQPRVNVKKLFTAAQHSRAACKNNLAKLKELYNNLEPEDFLADFILCLRRVFINPEKASMLENCLHFGAMFCSSILEEDPEASPEEVAEKNTMFISSVFNFLFQASIATDHNVRLRTCQFLNKILCQLGDEASLDDEICSKLSTHMIERLKDKSSSVRTQAVQALHRLQEPSNPECPVISNFLYHLETDPSHDVRKTILPVLARTASTIPHIIQRIYDIKDTVRRQAYNELAKLKMRSLTIKQRESLLRQGLKDRSDIVRACVGRKLLASWLDGTNGNYFTLLHSLDVEIYTDTCSLALNTLFEQNHIESLIENLKPLMEDGVVIVDKLSSTVAFYWTNLAKFICKRRENELEKKEEELGRITPNLSPFVSYVRNYYKSRQALEDSTQDPFVAMRYKFILLQLLDLASVFDLADEMGRSELKNLIFEMLNDDNVKDKFIPCLVQLLVDVIPVVNDRLQQLAETISEIREPLQQVTIERSEDDGMQLKLREAEIRVKLNEAKEQLEDAVRAQDFSKAQEMKSEVAQLQQDLSNLQLEVPEPIHEEVRQERTDRDTIHKCLCIVFEMMQSPDVPNLTPQLRSLYNNFVLPLVHANIDDVELHAQAIKTLACMCLLDKELAIEHILLFCVQLVSFQHEDISVAALTAIFDLLHLYGLEDFKIAAKDDEKPTNKSRSKRLYDATMNDFEPDADMEVTGNDSVELTTSNVNGSQMPEKEELQLISILTELLDNPTSALKLAAVKGICRLLINSRIVSANLISRLVILWFKPGADENDERLKQYLGVFFSGYATACSRSGEILEQAFLPTLQTLFNAPVTSPLSTIDITSVGRLFIGLTRPGLSEKNDHINIHNNWALLICNEILKAQESDFKGILLSLLPHLYITTEDAVFQEQLQILIDKIKAITTDKSSLRYINRFQQILVQGRNITHTTATTSTRESTMRESVGARDSNSRRESHSGTNSSIESNPPTSGRLTKKLSVNPALSTVMERSEDSEAESEAGKLSCVSEYSCDDLDDEQVIEKTNAVIPESSCSDSE